MADWLIVVLISATVRADPLEGFRTYQPVYRERRRVRGARVYVTRPLLGRYILAELDADWPRQFHLIRRVECVRGILTAEEKPVVAREAQVTALRARERRGGSPGPPRGARHVGQPGAGAPGVVREHRSAPVQER